MKSQSKYLFKLFTIFAMLISLFGSAVTFTPARADSTILVNTTADEDNTGADCSLREAITAANTNAAYGGCVAGSGNDTITIPAGTYTLTIAGTAENANATGDLDITESVTINGAGAGSTIIQAGPTAGSGIDLVFQVVGSITANISGVSIANGNGGASYAGGLANSGATVTITNSIFSGNNAHGSGAIDNDGGTVVVLNSTFSENSATGDSGGAIYNLSGTLFITNSTFSDNSALVNGGGIYNDNGQLIVINSTFSGNSAASGGGIGSNINLVTLLNTIIASSPSGSDCSGVSALNTNSYNLDSDGTCGDATQKTIAEINLGALADNGGSTPTFALLTGSSALDAGDDVICSTPPVNSTSQNGVTRPQGTHCDVGSFEAAPTQTGPAFSVNVTADSSDGFCDLPGQGLGNQDCTLREAISAANALVGADTITIPAGTYTLTIFGDNEDANANGDLDITDAVTINGAGADVTTIQAGTIPSSGIDRVFNTISTTVNISGVTIANGSALTGSGLYVLGGQVTIANSVFTENIAYTSGAIENDGGTLTITDSTFSHNIGGNAAGGIGNNGGTLSITNSTFSSNFAGVHGGGIYNDNGQLIVINSTFSGNAATIGGGIFSLSDTVTLFNTIIANSSPGGDCSGVSALGVNNYNLDSDGTCGDATQKTSAEINLGALADNGGSTPTFALLTNSSAKDAGDDAVCAASPVNNTSQNGVIRPHGAHCDIGSFEAASTQTGPAFTVNATADSDDGFCDLPGQGLGNQDCTLREAIHAANALVGADTITIPAGTYTLTIAGANEDANASGDLDIADPVTINGAGAGSTIVQAGPAAGSGIDRVFHITGTFSASISSVTIANGKCDLCGGGGIANFSGNLTLTNSILSNNSAAFGGGIDTYGTLTATNTSFANNTAQIGGGGLQNGGTLSVTQSTFTDNVSDDGAGLGSGGGFQNAGGPAVLANVTFSGNQANGALDDGGGAIIVYGGSVTLTNATVSGNGTTSTGGGIKAMEGALILYNSILANSVSGGDCFKSALGLVAGNNNLIESDGGGVNDCGTLSPLTGDPQLGTLTGSPAYFPLNNGSLAIDAGNDVLCATALMNNTSQNGVSRPQGAHCDIGAYEKVVFADVPIPYWAGSYIERLYNAGITGGCTAVPLNYCPTTPVTRAQMAIFLLRGMHGSAYAPPAATGTVFTDVPLGTFAGAWIEQLATEGITSGCGGGNYCPTQTVSRAQMAIFLVRAKHGVAFVPPTATGIFPDVPVGSFGANYIEQLVADAITSGCGGGLYCPNTTVKRDSMAVFLVKTFNLP